MLIYDKEGRDFWGIMNEVAHGKVMLRDVLEGSGQPVSEEQAWALCYQCSCKLKQMGDGDFPALGGIAHICIHQDGAVSFVNSTDAKDAKLSEKKVIERLGKAVYNALDWGLSSEVERVLSDSLDNLLLYMLDLHTPNNHSPAVTRHAFTLNDIIKECVERLFVPSEASTHYRAVCRIQYAESKHFHNLLETIQLSKQSLKRLDLTEGLKDEILGTLWSAVMSELRLGVSLRSFYQRFYTALPVEYTLTPYELLMNDIRLKRHALRPVKVLTRQSPKEEDSAITDDNLDMAWNMMNKIRLGVHLRSIDQRSYPALPVEYTLTPYELLMNDIRSKRHSLRPVEVLTRQSPKEEDSAITDDNLDMVWNNMMNEIRLGVSLRSTDQRSYSALPVQYTLSPYEHLMNDIQSKRYILRPVQECDQTKSSKSEENVILDLIRSHTLKPASARKLKERSLETPSLHALLMSEIKSSKTLRPTTSDVKRNLMQDEEFKVSSNTCSLQRDYSLYSCRMGNRQSWLPVMDSLENGIDGRVGWHPESSYESLSDHKSSDLTSSSTDLSFFPVLTSSKVDLRMNSISNFEQSSYTHKRSSSYEGSFQSRSCRQSWRAPRIHLPPTISELIDVRRTTVKTEMLVFTSSKDYPGKKACSSCSRKRLFFSWLFSCKLCDRTICPECHIEMLMPFKQCLHLPVTFFKTLVLTRPSDPFSQAQKKQMFFREVLHWDYSSVPLVFEPKDMADNHSFCKRVMYNWTSMDICIKCQEYILQVLDTSHQREFPDRSLKSRSISESSAILPRH